MGKFVLGFPSKYSNEVKSKIFGLLCNDNR